MTVDSFSVKIDYFFSSFSLFCGLNFPGVSYVLNARYGGGPKGGHAATVPPTPLPHDRIYFSDLFFCFLGETFFPRSVCIFGGILHLIRCDWWCERSTASFGGLVTR